MVRDGNSAYLLKSAYFEVQAGDVWSQITDLKIVSYGARAMEVYYKYGDAAPYEATPCAWRKVAETSDSYNPGNWARVWPNWVNGFEPVVLPANQKVSFYVHLTGSSRGILGSSGGSVVDPYLALQSTVATSAVGEITMSQGRVGYEGEAFRPHSSSYNGQYRMYGMFGGLKFETIPPGSTLAPTAAPTALTAQGSLEVARSGVDYYQVMGLQFAVVNLGIKDVIVTGLEFLLAQAGTHRVEVWYRDGTYTGSSAGCDNWNNWCTQWTQASSTNIVAEQQDFSAAPPLNVNVKAQAITSFAIVSPTAKLFTKTVTSGAIRDAVLKIDSVSPIEDYHGSNLQTFHALSSSNVAFEGKIKYEVASSLCAAQSSAAWVVMDPLAAADSAEDLADVMDVMAGEEIEPERVNEGEVIEVETLQ